MICLEFKKNTQFEKHYDHVTIAIAEKKHVFGFNCATFVSQHM